MKKVSKYILSFALTLLCFSCADTDVEEFSVGNILGDGRVGVTLNVTTPESFSYLTRAISEENESVLEDKFTVFAFTDDNGEAGNLIFTVKTGDVNTESNLDSENAYPSDYGDYTTSPSIAWHEDSSGVGGRLYIEYYETQGPIHLFVLANVDIEKVETLLEGENGTDPTITTGMSFSDVTAALQPALDFDVTDDDLESIPMIGECELTDGITLGSTGSLSLRRSVAKFTVRVEYENERVMEVYGESIDYAPFQPESIIIENLNATYATVYSPYDEVPNISSLNEDEEIKYSPSFTFDEEWSYDESSDTWYKEIVFYVAETRNSRQAAYTDGTENTENPRISVLVEGVYNDFMDETQLESNWYRLDLIPEGATSSDEELEYILRNHHYKFVLSDVTKRGSSSREQALELSVPDNAPHEGSGDAYVIIEDESILSVTVESNVESGDDSNNEPYYVGVSSNDIEIDVYYGTTACARVKVVTNYDDWTLDPYSIPQDEDGNYAISFVWDSSAETLWLWLDDPEAVTVGETYVYYIVAGNIRKKMRVTIIDTTEEQEP